MSWVHFEVVSFGRSFVVDALAIQPNGTPSSSTSATSMPASYAVPLSHSF